MTWSNPSGRSAQRTCAACVAACAALLAGAIDPIGAALATVKTGAGDLIGLPPQDGVTAYLGVPYAAPPIGELRWRPPQDAPKWDGVRKAQQFGTSCMQSQPGSRLPWTEEFMTQGAVGEDCLYLNVWTPARTPNDRLPVMFWIYGGGFNEGSSSVAVYDGAGLAKKGVVVVTANYRVGPLGFLTHPELTKESPEKSSGNYGILDQIAALRWVNRNIGAFGGDPRQVTIFGQSAGGISVAVLMRSPHARGLFVRAIEQSGPGLLGRDRIGSASLPEREALGAKYAEAAGARSLAEMRALPAPAFFQPSAVPAPGGVVKDGWVMPLQDPSEQVPLMLGFTADDIGVATAGFGGAVKATRASYESDARRIYGEHAATFLKLYPAATDADVTAARKSAGRDRARVLLDLSAAAQLQASRRIYTYYFDRVIPWPAHPEFGAFHTSEVPYVFDTLSRLDRPWQPIDRRLAGMMSSYWANFATKGDPNGAGLPRWAAYDPGTHTTMQLGEKTGTMSVAAREKLEFFLARLAR